MLRFDKKRTKPLRLAQTNLQPWKKVLTDVKQSTCKYQYSTVFSNS